MVSRGRIYICNVCEQKRTILKTFTTMSNLQDNCRLKLGFQKVDKHVGGKWLIHGTKHTARQINCKAWNTPVEYSNWEWKLHTFDFHVNTTLFSNARVMV